MSDNLISCEKCVHCGDIVVFDNWNERVCNYSNRVIKISDRCLCQHFSLKEQNNNECHQQLNQEDKDQQKVITNAWPRTRAMIIKDIICSMSDPSSVTDNQLIRIFHIANKVIEELIKRENQK